jgi:hypothetical protein
MAVGLVIATCGPSLTIARRQLAGQPTGESDPFDAAAVA